MGDDGWDGIFEFLGVIANLELYLYQHIKGDGTIKKK